MSTKPVAAIERMRAWQAGKDWWVGVTADSSAILAYLDSIPDGAVPVVWPKELTRERLERLADGVNARVIDTANLNDALRALAAIAPVRKKRVVNLWLSRNSHRDVWPSVFSADYDPNEHDASKPWRCVARNVELED